MASERTYVAVPWVLKIQSDGGMFSGEYIGRGSSGGHIVVSDKEEAWHFDTREAAEDERRATADPFRLIAMPI